MLFGCCRSSQTNLLLFSWQPNRQGCSACEFAIGGLQQYVNDTSALIVRASARDICNYHMDTAEEKKMCHVMLRGFGQAMLRVLASRLDAADFCCGLGLCHALANELAWVAPSTSSGEVTDMRESQGPGAL